MPKQSQSYKRLPTEKDRSQTPLQKPPELPEKQETMSQPQEDSSMLSDDQLTEAISMGSLLATLDALSMVQRRAQDLRLQKSQLLKDSMSQVG